MNFLVLLTRKVAFSRLWYQKTARFVPVFCDQELCCESPQAVDSYSVFWMVLPGKLKKLVESSLDGSWFTFLQFTDRKMHENFNGVWILSLYCQEGHNFLLFHLVLGRTYIFCSFLVQGKSFGLICHKSAFQRREYIQSTKALLHFRTTGPFTLDRQCAQTCWLRDLPVSIAGAVIESRAWAANVFECQDAFKLW